MPSLTCHLRFNSRRGDLGVCMHVLLNRMAALDRPVTGKQGMQFYMEIYILLHWSNLSLMVRFMGCRTTLARVRDIDFIQLCACNDL